MKTKQGKAIQTPPSSPPSASSSPSHEFSFTISLHPTSSLPHKTKSSPPSFAIDLSPADDIFFHGHLLPLHLLSHLPISPRASTNSHESFSIPLDDQKLTKNMSHNSNKSKSNNITKEKTKAKTFSLFRFSRRRKLGSEVQENEEEIKKKRKIRFNVSHIIRRYVRIIRPLLIFKGGRRESGKLRRQPYSFSGNLSWKGKQELKGRREFSAPASLWTSPTNSGPLVANTSISSSKSDSTMEELQSAIQAAIAHCKNSITVKEEKLNC